MFIKRRRKIRSSSIKTELDHYLEEDVIKRTPDFDILNWWKTNGIMYPTLQAIAKDLLSFIPASLLAQIIWGSSVTVQVT
ncbi:hypothetical protein Lal_00033549 [Lupinus albus]|nr:hypothetical protein Lal_00033549 [Lupinus albus]